MKTIEELQKLIDDNKIDCPYYFEMYYEEYYIYCLKNNLLCKLKFSYLNDPKFTIEFIQDIINIDPKIKSPRDLEILYPKVYNYACHRKYNSKLNFNTRRLKTDRSLEDVQKLIDDLGLTRKEFRENYNTEYVYSQRYGYLDKLKYKEPYSIEEIQKIITDNNFTEKEFNKSEEYKEYRNYVHKFKKKKFLKFRQVPKIEKPEPLLKETSVKKSSYEQVKSLEKYDPEHPDSLIGIVKYTFEDVQNIINSDERIQRPMDLKKLYAQRRDYLKYLDFGGFKPKYSLEDIQKVIDNDDRVKTRADFHNFLPKYERFSCKYGYTDKLVFERSNEHQSYMNKMLINYFRDKGILVEPEMKFDWLVYKQKLKLDLYLPEYNVAIEAQGNQHFMATKDRPYVKTEEELLYVQTRDVNKYILCKENNIKIFYFANKNEQYFDRIKDCIDNYFSYVYLDVDQLYLDIIKLPKISRYE